jgi:DNA-binding MarR family transcriptional regulator
MKGGHQIAMALRAAYLAMHRQAEAHLAPKGVTADQFVLLSALAQGKAVTQQDLVRRLSSDPNTVGAMLVLLENRGILVREPHPTDRRARTVALTPKGRRLFKRLWAQNRAFRAHLVATFNRPEARALISYLGRIADTMSNMQEIKELTSVK